MLAFLKIVERKGQMGVRLVNNDGEFFLFGKNLIALWRNRGRHVLVKQHNADTKSAIAYHPGQIVGLIDGDEEEVVVRIYKGGVGRVIGLDNENSLTNVVQRESYPLATPDIEKVVAAFEVNQRHSLGFEELALVGSPMVLPQVAEGVANAY